MKIKNLLTTTIVVFLSAIAFSSCSKDEMSERKMVGCWEVSKLTLSIVGVDGNETSETMNDVGVRVEFIKGGALNLYSKNKETGDWTIEQADAAWSCEGDKLVLTGVDEDADKDGISTKTNLKFTIENQERNSMTLLYSTQLSTEDKNYGGLKASAYLVKVKK